MSYDCNDVTPSIFLFRISIYDWDFLVNAYFDIAINPLMAWYEPIDITLMIFWQQLTNIHKKNFPLTHKCIGGLALCVTQTSLHTGI